MLSRDLDRLRRLFNDRAHACKFTPTEVREMARMMERYAIHARILEIVQAMAAAAQITDEMRALGIRECVAMEGGE
jgi:hypothetical protein